jgi:hypothetical protein
LKKKSVSEKVSSTIGAGRTIYDEDSYNRLAVPTAEQTILSMAIDQFAAQAAIDEVMCYGREADRRGKRRETDRLCARAYAPLTTSCATHLCCLKPRFNYIP